MSQHIVVKRIPDGWEDDGPPDENPASASSATSEPAQPKPPLGAAATPTAAPSNASQGTASTLSTPAIAFPHSGDLSLFPAFVARSSLFRVGRGKNKAPTELSGKVGSHKQYAIERLGPRLGMWDKGVWEAAMAAAKRAGHIGPEFRISLMSILEAMGSKDRSVKSMKRVFASLERLAATRVSFSFANTLRGGGGMLLASARRQSRQCFIALDPAFAEPAFSLNLQFRMLPARRREMTSDLGQWLHDFLSINQEYGDGFDLGTLRIMCGYEGAAGRFPSLVQAAMRELRDLPALPDRGDRGTVVASFSIRKSGGGVDKWRLLVKPGTEKPSFEMHEADKALKTPPGRPKKPAPKRGGVAL